MASEPGPGPCMHTMPLGTVAGLWRYPVKSLRGEACTSLHFDSRGVAGDRLYAVRNPEGKFGSGKSTRRFRQMDGLLDYSARYVQAARGAVLPELRFPDGLLLRGDSPAMDGALSEALGQPVTLAREAEVSHFDAAPVHLLSTASLQWLGEALPGVDVDARRFRPNLLIQCGPGVPAAPAELAWIGRTLRLGDAVRLRISAAAERCGMVTLAQGELAREAGVLRHIAQAADMKFGVYAQVLVPGLVRAGDPVSLEP